MGQFLGHLQNAQPPQSNPLLNNSISKLREYHGSFQSVCDTFSIDLTEFEQIFGSNETMFQIWDTDNNGLINALELFSGLIIFAESNFEEKARFLFDLFDFNELNSLSLIDLDFMLLSCANATFKIMQINNEVNEEEISDFLSNFFSDNQRVNISQFLKWCVKTDEIRQFLQLIKKEAPELKVTAQTEQLSQKIDVLRQVFSKEFGKKLLLPDSKRPYFDQRGLGSILSSKAYHSKIQWISSLAKKVYAPQPQVFQKDVYAKMNWVYGFRGKDVKRPLLYIKMQSNTDTALNEKMIFFTACIIIVYYPKINEQRHYLEHESEVISVAVANNLSLMASGEYAEQPAIHIWDNNTLHNIGVIKGVHQKGVHLLTFFGNDELLASCGIRVASPILIYNIKDFSLVLSTQVNEFAVDLLTIKNFIGSFGGAQHRQQQINQQNQLNPFKKYENSFVVCTIYQIIQFQYYDGHFLTKEIQLEQYNLSSPLTCATALRIYSRDPYLKAYQSEEGEAIVIISGHQNGAVILWENFERMDLMTSYKDQIVCITSYQFGIIIGTDASTIHLWDFKFKNNIKNIDLTAFSFKLFSYVISDIVVAGDKLLVASTEGDVVEIFLQQKQEHSSNSFVNKLRANRINYIIQLSGTLQALCILERPDSDDKLVFCAGSQSTVYGFSLETHEIVDVWTIGDQISSMDCINFEDGGAVFALGTVSGKVYLRLDWEESPRWYDCKHQVNDLKFSSDTSCLVCAVQDAFVYVFFLNNTSYFQTAPKKIHFEGEFPICLDFVDDCKAFIVGTTMKNQYKIELPDLKSKNLLQENEKLNSTTWVIRYPLSSSSNQNSKKEQYLPLLIGGDVKIFLAAGEGGYVYFWRDREQLETNCGGFLRGHASNVSRLQMTKSQDVFYTVGTNDNTLIEWKIDFINDLADFSKPFQQDDKLQINKPGLNNFSMASNKQDFNQTIDEIFKREKDYCFFLNNISDKFRDNFVQFRATNQKMLNGLLQELIPPFDKKQHVMKRAPPLSLTLDYIYGFLAYDKRRTLFYVHFYNKQEKKRRGGQQQQDLKSEQRKRMEQMNQQSIMLPVQFQKEMLLAKQALLPYDDFHNDCQRHFVYITSRIAVVYNPLNNQQKFYEGHRFKITCLAIHPLKCFVATGESAPRPCIHVWNVFNTEPVKIIRTNHKNGIYDLVFSRDSLFIVSIGIDETYSIQVTSWKNETIIAFRNSGTFPICCVMFNPYNRYEFATCGYQNITIWSLQGRNLIRSQVILSDEVKYSNGCFITCLSYISYLLSDKIESDIIVGNNFGDLALVSCGKYIVVKERAHQKMINCLKISEILGDKVVIITCGEDEYIKIWDTKFNLINEFNIRKTGFFQDGTPAIRNLSAQSIDIFSCKVPKRQLNEEEVEESHNLSVMLVGTRNGDILEAAFQVESQGLKLQQIRKQESHSDDEHSNSHDSSGSEQQQRQHYTTTETLKFNYSIYMRSHQSQIFDSKQQIDFFNKKMFITLHPTQPIMVSMGEDQKLILWDTENNSLLLVKNMGMTPTAIRLSPDGDLLVIGFQNSMVVIMDSKIQKNTMGKVSERYLLPSLDIIMNIKDKDNKTPVLNIEFSHKGDMLAISYDNARSQKDVFDSKLEKEGSFISVWVNRGSHRTSKYRATDKNLYLKYTDIRCPSLYESYQTDNDTYGVAAYFMTFSQDGNYLLIYYQLINNQQTRINNDPQGVYIIWDLNSNTSVKNWETIKNIQWKKLNFPNSLHSQYQFYDSLIGNPKQKQEQETNLANEILKTPVMSVMVDISPFLICGSTNGDLHLVKSSCLYYDKDFITEISKKQKCLAKSYSAHVSFVNQIETHQNAQYLYTTGILDECIMKWKLTEEQQNWDLDYLIYDKKQADLFQEVQEKEKFKSLFSELLPLRQGISDKVKNVDDTKQPEVELKLESIIGRRAFTRRNNLFYDYDERLIYVAGCNLVIASLDDEDEQDDKITSQFKKYNGGQLQSENNSVFQQFIKLDQSDTSSSPEISCITLSQDKKLLCAGTIELNAKLLIWDICSRTCVKNIVINNAVMIMNIKFAYDNRHLICNAITQEYRQEILLIDSENHQVLGVVTYTYSIPYKIKDLEFYPNSVFRFVTCGVQHMSCWQFAGGSLTFQAMEIENPKDLVELVENQNDEQEGVQDNEQEQDALRITFLTVIFVQDAIITAGEDGFIYVWDDKKINKKQKAHPDQPIFCLYTSKDSSMFVSGGMDGRVILWSLSKSEYSYVVEKIYEYSIANEQLQKVGLNPNLHVQSVCIGQNYILAGTRSGDIYELVRPNESDLKSLTKIQKDMVKLRINCTDHDQPKVVAFSGNAQKLYSITQKGLFAVWNLRKLKRTYSFAFEKATLNLIVCKLSPKIIIAFEQEVIVLNDHDYSVNSNYSLKQKSAISDMKLSVDEKMLALALSRNQEQNAKIEIYDVENEENNFRLLCSIDNLNTSVEYLDFSTDNFYLFYKDVSDETALIDLDQQKRINSMHMEFDLEWCSDGIKLAEKAKGVHSCYTDENRIHKITLIGDKSMAVTDDMGTIRIFNYPCTSGQGYMRIYTDHMMYINQCVASPDKETLVTTSEQDKCIMVWKIQKVDVNNTQ
ncbi:unnamed protein product [Paramecium pentaurelia]|uniref:EF-hand domain-containing protein n=1 Tax=Paramecium pentaurelia TaxID=43138 RepID=A0A8S1W3E1_9CILI|nr:unnamed protein product [Paramecium pentaurelia]